MSADTGFTAVREAPPADHGLKVKHLSPFIGTEVFGIDLKAQQDQATKDALNRLLWDRGVIFLRDQNLSPEQQLAATAIFGTPKVSENYREGSPIPGVGAIDSIEEIAGRVSRWHADLTSETAPQSVRLLQAVTLPEYGGDTLWASAEAAYDRLAAPLQELARSLTAIHAVTPIKISEWTKPNRRGRFHWAEHPVVRAHPHTGRPSLYVNPRFTQEIVGLRPHESAAVLKVFYDHILLPEHQVRFHWEVGSLAIWDNRNTLHYAADDYGSARRIMYGSGIESEPPIGVEA